MTPEQFTAEKTTLGLQYVIPGAERVSKPKRPSFKADKTPAGDQLVILGAERISVGEYVSRLANRPITPRRGQIGLQGTALFGS